MAETLTTKEAAERLDITPSRVRQLILSGKLPAEKFGRDLVIYEKDLALVADRKPGRPPLTDEEKAARAKAQKRTAGVQASLFEPTTSAKSPRRARAKTTGVKKAAKKKGGAAK